MYCPRCSAPITETTKFCKSCGLPLAEVASFVATGGTHPLTPPAAPPAQAGSLTPKQRLTLTILLWVFAPAIFGVIGTMLPWGDDLTAMLAGLAAVIMPLGILWAIFQYWNQTRKTPPEAPPSRLPDAAYQPPLPPLRTNPLAAAGPPRGSVIEDETQRLPEKK